MEMSEDICVTFVIPKDCRDENDCSEEMQLAFVTCEQHCGGGLQAKWIHETHWTQFEGLSKRDVFVLAEFEGELYEKLQKTKCLLVGPRCLSCCLTEGTPIPSGPEPVFTIAMRGLVVTASGLSKQQKESIKQKVHWMGGIYSTVLTDDTTHLVSNTVLSDKYMKSVEKGIPVMSISWIEAVWDASLRINVSGSSPDFVAHRLPPFANLQVTTSGITKKEKLTIMKLVNEHGGTFSGAFQSETTDVVVLTKEGVGSEKYKAALEYGKALVLPAWVRESAAAGRALPPARYRPPAAHTSSPLAGAPPDMSLNFSRITNARAPSNFVDETRSADVSAACANFKPTQEARASDAGAEAEALSAFEELDMSLVKRAGPIFDGFCVWVSGLEAWGAMRERVLACAARCGGVRCDAPGPRVTHAVAGSRCAARAARALAPHAPPLSPLWLLRSVQARRALPEHQFVLDESPRTPQRRARAGPGAGSTASPMSARNLALLRHAPPPPAHLPPPPAPADQLVHHYLSQPAPEAEPRAVSPPPPPRDVTDEPPDADEPSDEPSEDIAPIFRDVRLEVQGLDAEATAELRAELAAAGGALPAAPAGAPLALVPLDFDERELRSPRAAPVTVFWIKDCLSQQEIVPIQYYHRPVHVVWAAPPLAGVVASLSTYSGVERAFLDELAKLLGATTQLRFCRRSTATARASTHLVCPAPSGDKYLGARKWGLPAVRAAWLLACAAAGARVPERPYLVGDTAAPDTPAEERAEPAPAPAPAPCPAPDPAPAPASSPAPADTDTDTDKENALQAVPPPHAEAGELSPASRYIAMARQGLLGSQDSPAPAAPPARPGGAECAEGTPQLEDALSSPNLARLSPTTRRRLRAVRRGEAPSDPVRTPQDPFDRPVATPDSAFGCALRPGAARLSPDARKRLWSVVQRLPARAAPATPHERAHTPLSEIRNRFLAQFHDAPAHSPPADAAHAHAPRKLLLDERGETPPAKIAKVSEYQSPGGFSAIEPALSPEEKGVEAEPAVEEAEPAAEVARVEVAGAEVAGAEAVDAALQRLTAALAGRASTAASQRARRTRDSLAAEPPVADSEPAPESQPNTVGWDDTRPAPSAGEPERPPEPVRRFMLSSNVDNREEIARMVQALGGAVSEGAELDARATHLLCAAPGRSEKMLGSVAAGRWVLHPSYVAHSHARGAFLPEEQYEWGNPLAAALPALGGAERALARAAYRWRAARAAGAAGPFAGLVALLHVPAPRRRLLRRLVEAGGGAAPELSPPYGEAAGAESVTACFADVRRLPLAARDAAWLAARRVPLVAPVLLSALLTDEPAPRLADHALAP